MECSVRSVFAAHLVVSLAKVEIAVSIVVVALLLLLGG